MASAALGDELSCSICLNIYTEPVSLRCGHNFCQDCIVIALDTQEGSGVYSCPECRKEYTERPTLEKNRKLCNIVEFFRSTQAKTEGTKIFCTYCVDFPVPASKTCLQCETSLCEKHLLAHNKSAAHFLTEPTTSFADIKCPIHKEILKYYCTQDNVCICMSCWVAGDHVGHKMELLNEACEKKKEKLKEDRVKLTHCRQGIEMRIQNLENHYIKEEKKAADATGRVTELFRDIRRHLDDVEKRVLTEVSRQKEKISQSVSNLVRMLEEQKDKLCKTVYDIEQFLDITDQITFLKTEIKSDDISISGDINSDVSDAGCLDEVMTSLMLNRGLCLFTKNLKHLRKSQKFLMTENSDVLLDRKTADNSITISQDLRSATYLCTHQKKLIDPEILQGVQLLSTRNFSAGRHYWEVEVSGAEEWRIGVAAHSIKRMVNRLKKSININNNSQGSKEELGMFGFGEKSLFGHFNDKPRAFTFAKQEEASTFCFGPAPSLFIQKPQAIHLNDKNRATDLNDKSWAIGFNDKSWALQFIKKLLASHNDVHETIISDSLVKTVGIYLDYNEGRLSFYQMCDPIRHLHTFTTTFTEPLYAAFTLPKSGSIRIIP